MLLDLIAMHWWGLQIMDGLKKRKQLGQWYMTKVLFLYSSSINSY